MKKKKEHHYDMIPRQDRNDVYTVKKKTAQKSQHSIGKYF